MFKDKFSQWVCRAGTAILLLAIVWYFIFGPSSKPDQPGVGTGILFVTFAFLFFFGAQHAKDQNATAAKTLTYFAATAFVLGLLVFAGSFRVLASMMKNIPLNRGETWFVMVGILAILFSEKNSKLGWIGYLFTLAGITMLLLRHTIPGFDLQGNWFDWNDVIQNTSVAVGLALLIPTFFMFSKSMNLRGTILGVMALYFLYAGITIQHPELEQVVKKLPLPSATASPGGFFEAVGVHWDNLVDSVRIDGERQRQRIEEEKKKLSLPPRVAPAATPAPAVAPAPTHAPPSTSMSTSTPTPTPTPAPTTLAPATVSTPSKMVFDGLLMMRETPVLNLETGIYTSSNPDLAYAADGINFNQISGNRFEVKTDDRNPRVRALKGGAFKIHKM